MEQDEPISTRVIEEIAKRRGVDPIEMRPYLYDVIDPDGLDQLFSETTKSRKESAVRVEFTYDEYVVTIEDSRDITVTKQATSGGTDEGISASSSTN